MVSPQSAPLCSLRPLPAADVSRIATLVARGGSFPSPVNLDRLDDAMPRVAAVLGLVAERVPSMFAGLAGWSLVGPDGSIAAAVSMGDGRLHVAWRAAR